MINGTVHIFFLKKSYLSPWWPKLAQFFSSGVFPSYLHVISDFCHIWGPFMAKIEKMCQKSAFLVVPSQNHWKWPTFTTIVQAPWSKKSYFSDFSSNTWYLYRNLVMSSFQPCMICWIRRSNHENIDALTLIGLVTEGEGGEGGGKSNCKVGTRWVRQL